MTRGRKDKDIAHDLESAIGAQMRLARQKSGITITEMAKLCNYTKSHLSNVENGTKKPSPRLIQHYETLLEIPLTTEPKQKKTKTTLGIELTTRAGDLLKETLKKLYPDQSISLLTSLASSATDTPEDPIKTTLNWLTLAQELEYELYCVIRHMPLHITAEDEKHISEKTTKMIDKFTSETKTKTRYFLVTKVKKEDDNKIATLLSRYCSITILVACLEALLEESGETLDHIVLLRRPRQ